MGERTPKPEHVAQVLATLGIVGKPYDELMSLAYDMTAPMWVASSLPARQQQLAVLIEMEQNAVDIVDVSPSLVPGLLQTKEYAHAIMSGGGLSPDEVVTRVAVRMERQNAIYRTDPVRFTAYIGEAVIRQIIGDRKVMAAQLHHLLEMARRPNIVIRVVPYDSGWQPSLEGYFSLIRTDNTFPIVHVELRKTGIFLHDAEDVDAYQDAVDLVAEAALPPAASARLVTEAAHRMESS